MFYLKDIAILLV